ncbi:MAG: hypothetical protein ACKO5C_02930 [Ferruginibacter sp.]
MTNRNLLFLFALPFVLTACCLGNAKCKISSNVVNARLIDLTTGKDLFFGDSARFRNGTPVFYSFIGTDSVTHTVKRQEYNSTNADSVLTIQFDARSLTTVYVKLPDGDLDTLAISYPLNEGSACCDAYSTVAPLRYNRQPIQSGLSDVLILGK